MSAAEALRERGGLRRCAANPPYCPSGLRLEGRAHHGLVEWRLAGRRVYPGGSLQDTWHPLRSDRRCIHSGRSFSLPASSRCYGRGCRSRESVSRTRCRPVGERTVENSVGADFSAAPAGARTGLRPATRCQWHLQAAVPEASDTGRARGYPVPAAMHRMVRGQTASTTLASTAKIRKTAVTAGRAPR